MGRIVLHRTTRPSSTEKTLVSLKDWEPATIVLVGGGVVTAEAREPIRSDAATKAQVPEC